MRNELHTSETVGEDKAQSTARSLLKHAREVYRYAVNYCVPNESNAYIDARTRAAFIRQLNRMVKDLRGLMNLAMEKGVTYHCNVEQIEAYMSAAREVILNQELPAEFPVNLN